MRFLHFSDLHLGLENYGRIDSSTGLHTRVRDFVHSLSFVFDLAIDAEVDLVLFAGDAYRNCDPTPTHQREFARQLRRLHQAAIPIVLVVGNHDAPTAFGKASSVDIFSALELDNIHVIRSPALLRLETRGGPVQIAGIPWPTRHLLRTRDEYKDLLQADLDEKIAAICTLQIDEFARRLDPSLPAVLTAHIAAAEATYSGSERTALIGRDPTVMSSALAHPAFDYVALGHVHKYQNLHPAAAPPVVYAGSIERIDFGEEKDQKGCCLVVVEEARAAGEGPASRTTSYEFIPTPARRFVTVQVEVAAGDEDPTRLLLEAIAAAPIEDAVVRVIYSLPAGGPDRVEHQRLRAALAPAFHLAGILPRVQPAARQRRAAISRDLGLQDALDKYIDNLPALHGERRILKRYARKLEAELELSTRKEQVP